MAGTFFALEALGVGDARSFFKDLSADIKGGMRDRLKKAAKLVSDTAKRKTHSRRVKAAISFDVRADSLAQFSAVVGPLRRKAFFAHFLEFGTVHSRARPFLIPAKKETEDDVVEIVGVPFLLQGPRS